MPSRHEVIAGHGEDSEATSHEISLRFERIDGQHVTLPSRPIAGVSAADFGFLRSI